MSRLLSLLNRLKSEARCEILTDSQLVAFEEIEKHMLFPTRVNLWGEQGSGKTLLGWVVTRTRNACFYASPRSFFCGTQRAGYLTIIDNVLGHSEDMRSLIAELQLRDAKRVLFITRRPNRLGVPTVHLGSPTQRDVDTVYRNLSLVEYYALSPIYSQNLWEVVHSVL